MEESPVKVHIYDLSKGLARMLSPMYLGKQIDGVWHTGVVVYGKEYFFGSFGIENCLPGHTILGPPDTIVDLGITSLPYDVFVDWLNGAAMTTFKGSRYHILDHNCNNFSNELAQFLTGQRIPAHITDLPSDIMGTPIGTQLRAMMESIEESGTPVGPDPSRPHGQDTNSPISEPVPSNPTAAASGNYPNNNSMSTTPRPPAPGTPPLD